MTDRYQAAILDVDGTIVRGERLLSGATDGLRALEDANVSRLLFSNNPTRGAAHYGEKLAAHGVDVRPRDVLTSATVTASYLAENHPDEAVYLVGEPRLRRILEDAGLSVAAEPTDAEVVVGSIDRELAFETLSAALVALERDVPFYGTDPDVTIPTDEGSIPGSGTILAAMEAMAGRPVDGILGKPSAVAAEAAMHRLEADPARTLVVGDRLDTDIKLGADAGMDTAVVLTGVTTRATVEASDLTPDYVLESLADVGELLE